jgi:nucleotide-binding universal stress UspA family protein
MPNAAVRHIVVGTDGSANADHAVRAALQLAAASGADVAVVSAWRREFTRDAASFGEAFLTDDDLSVATLTLIDETLLRVAPEVAAVEAAGSSVLRHAIEGDAEDVLMKAAAEADVLVVGRRGHHGLGARLLGTTSRHLADHAPCPVLVVPEPVG